MDETKCVANLMDRHFAGSFKEQVMIGGKSVQLIPESVVGNNGNASAKRSLSEDVR